MTVRNLLLRMPVRTLVFPGPAWPTRPSYPLPPQPLATDPMLNAPNLTGSTLEAYRVLAIDTGTGGWVYADCTIPSHADTVLAISSAPILPGMIGSALNQGSISNNSWAWTIGQTLFLGTAGQLSRFIDLPPVRIFDREIGVAKSPTDLVVDPEPAILKG